MEFFVAVAVAVVGEDDEGEVLLFVVSCVTLLIFDSELIFFSDELSIQREADDDGETKLTFDFDFSCCCSSLRFSS